MAHGLKTTRKALFKAALSLAGMTQKEWALGNGVNPQHLNGVISETQDRGGSKALIAKIDAFIQKNGTKGRKRYEDFIRHLAA